MHNLARFSRRDFMKLAGLGLGALAFNPSRPWREPARLPQFPAGDQLGRVAVQPNFNSTPLRSQPNENASKIRDVPQDEIVVWQREAVGSSVSGRTNTRWVETPEGFIYTVDLQPVKNLPNQPLMAIPQGKSGFWAEVTVPYVDLQIQNAPISPAMKYLLQYYQPVRLYYGQVVWIDQLGTQDGHTVLYHVNEAQGHGYGYGDTFLAEGAAFHALTEQDVAPISPDVDPATKKITIDSTGERQTLSCYEGNTEVYYCRVSTGYVDSSVDFSTPQGDQALSWKIFSIHMAANTVNKGGYDTMGVPWPIYFNQPAGAAIHGAFWHNDFGVRRSHGCVNVSPEDAKWIFRWTTPALTLDQSEWRTTDWTKIGKEFSTSVTVTEEKA